MIDVDLAGRDRPALPASGRDRHAVVRHDRLRLARRQRGDRARSRLDGTGTRPARPARAASCTRLGFGVNADGRLLLAARRRRRRAGRRHPRRVPRSQGRARHRDRRRQGRRGRAQQGVERALRPVPARSLRRAAATTRRPTVTTIEINDDTPARTNGSPSKSSQLEFEAAVDRPSNARKAREVGPPTITLPAGTHWPTTSNASSRW